MDSIIKIYKNQCYLIKKAWNYKKSFVVYKFINTIVTGIAPTLSILLYKLLVENLMSKNWTMAIWTIILIAVISCGVAVIKNIISKRIDIDEDFFRNILLFDVWAKTVNIDLHILQLPETTTLKERANDAIQRNLATKFFDYFFTIVSSIITITSTVVVLTMISPMVLIAIILVMSIKTITIIRDKKNKYTNSVALAPINKEATYCMQMLVDPLHSNEMRMYSISNWVLKRYKNLINKVMDLVKELIDASYRNDLLRDLLSVIQETYIYVFLSWQVIFNNMSFANFTMFFTALQTFSNKISLLITNIIDVGEAAIYVDAYREFLNIKNTIAIEGIGNTVKGIKAENTILNITNLSFKYPGCNNYVLDNVNLSIERNKFYVIIGANGAGKTTLTKLISRLYDPDQGEILYNNVDIKTLNFKEYRTLFGVVFQDYKYYDLSIAENIAMDEYDCSERIRNKIYSCLKKANLLDMVNKLPKGIDTRLGRLFDDDGIMISGGEAQKLALAKALFKDSPILILDEPSSALDAFAEEELINTFNKAGYGKTILYISHRLSVAKYAHKVIFIDNCKIEAYDTHTNLLKNCRRYSLMYDAQAKHYKE